MVQCTFKSHNSSMVHQKPVNGTHQVRFSLSERHYVLGVSVAKHNGVNTKKISIDTCTHCFIIKEQFGKCVS